MLGEYLAAAQAKTFRYGRHDCALFAVAWAKAKSGRDLSLGLRHRSLREGIELLRAAGYRDHVEAFAAQTEEVPVLMAQRGDVAVVNGCLGIVTGERVALVQRRGLVTVPLTAATRVFRV